MLSGQQPLSKQELVAYGRPAEQVLSELASSWGAERILVTTTRSLARGKAEEIADALGQRCAGTFAAIGAHSPRENIIAGAALARELDADLLVAVGGGSVIDATKIIQLCLWGDVRAAGDLDSLLPGAANRHLVEASQVRMIAVPTTLSAAEFTPYAGAMDPQKGKQRFTHPLMAPRAVVLDPAMTLSTPATLWFSTGMKAVDHAVEQLCNPQRSPFGDALAADGLRRLTLGLAQVRKAPEDLEARLECQFGMWLAISGSPGRGMGASHAIGHTLGGSYGVPHGITSCVMLPAVLRWNESAAREREQLVAQLMGRPNEAAADVVKALVESLELPTSLRSVGVERNAFRAIAEHTLHDRSVASNPRRIGGADDIVEILELAAG